MEMIGCIEIYTTPIRHSQSYDAVMISIVPTEKQEFCII